MADITTAEIEEGVHSILPVGANGVQFTAEHIHKFNRSHATTATASNELNAVTVEFQDSNGLADDHTSDEFNEAQKGAITNQVHEKHRPALAELESQLRELAHEMGYTLVPRDRVNSQWNRLMYEFRAPLTGEAKWLKDE